MFTSEKERKNRYTASLLDKLEQYLQETTETLCKRVDNRCEFSIQ